MKKMILFAAIISILSFNFNTSAYATGPLGKLGRGVTDIFIFPLEFFNAIGETTEDTDLAHGLSLGLIKGIWMMGARIVSGLYDIVTFPIPIPFDYEPIVEETIFIWDMN